MGKGGKDNCKTNFKNRVRSKDKDSDDSDEDYVVEVEENASDYDSEELVNSVDEYASEESYVEEEEEDEEEEEGFRKVVRSKTNKGSRANRRSGGKTSQKRKRVSYEEEEDDDYIDDDDFEADEDEDDVDYDDEFSPDDEDDFLDEEEELTEKRKSNNMKVAQRKVQRRGSRRGTKKRRKSKVSKKPSVKKGRKTRRLMKKVRREYDEEDDGDFVDDNVSVREKSRKNSSVRRRRRRYAVCSDSDVVSSGSSDYDFTISEEEREQMMEASQFYGEVKTGLRSISSVKKIQENGCEQEKPIARKGKEKIKEEKAEVVKPVCGICLSEEDKRRFRGTLNCCSHYFCFTCIIEWSKVESRCPLCKQRFNTITKNGRVAVGVDLRNVVIQVPKRDQVYQPTEEEIRSFIDPYENVICTECHEGGDDGLMLLCDLCDSPAHTYCVGLGMQVPDGNWYCEGCRPVALGPSSSQAQDPLPDQRTANNISNRPFPVMNNGEGLGPNLETSPWLSFSQGFGNLSSPRFPAGDVQAVSPVSGAGAAPTVSMRRQIHRHIQNMLFMSRRANRADGDSSANLQSDVSNPQVDPRRENIVQTQELGALQSAFLDARLQINDHPSTSMQNRDPFPLRPSQLRAVVVQDPTTDRPFNLTLFPELTDINSISGNQQFTQCNSRPGITCEINLPPHRGREESQFYVVKEQLQSVVKNHLRSLSQDIELGHDTFKEIARSSTHTILAACGLEHKRSEVQFVPPPSMCIHGDRLIAGQTSIMKDFCSPCFDSFVRGVVKRIMDRIMDTRLPQWLSLGL